VELAARRRRRTIVLVVALVLLLAAVAFALSLAGQAGRLPGQAEPTRVSTTLTPFAGLPGLSAHDATPEGLAPAVGTAAP
jgi:ABC-type transporter Mla subunit MlaD